MDMSRWTRFGGLALLAMLLAVSACDDPTDPAADFDPEDAAQTLQSMTAAVETDELEDAFGSVRLAGQLFGTVSMELAGESPLALDLSSAPESELTAADVIPSEYYGTTFEWSPTEMTYVASDATGAPEDGVRVIYYAIDPTTGQPATPLNPLGYVDLRDLSTAESNRLGVTVVRYADEATLADYYLDLSFSFTQSSIAINVASAGFLSNATDQLNFDLSSSVSATETLVTVTQSYSVDLEGTDRAMSFDATVTRDPQSESDQPDTMEAEATISTGTQTVQLDVGYADNVLEGTISSDGAPVVLIGGTLDEPMFTDPDGNPLTEEELDALRSMWEAIGELFEFVAELFGFATP